MAININRDVEDTFYRYKMPKLQTKVEGKGNGIKTVIVNVTDVAKALYRKPMYVTKYFGCELGAQVNADEKNDRYIVNGAHEADKLQALLDGFIKRFVLCSSCGNPETQLTVKKRSEIVKSTCKACGASKELDATHRLTQYIIKNPPADEVTTKSGAKAKKAKAEDSDEEEADPEPQHSPANSTNAAKSTAEDDDEDWGEDTTEEGQRKRMEELTSMAKSLALSADVEKSKKERTQMFFNTVSELYTKKQLLKEVNLVVDEADRLDLGSRALLVAVEVVLCQPDKIVQDLKAYSALFLHLIKSIDSAAKAQMSMLNAVITLIDAHPELMKKAPVMVKTMYDLDIAEEEVILQWADKKPNSKYGSKKVHEQVLSECQVIFKWLREAEEETSGDEDDDDNEEEAEKEDGRSEDDENEENTIPQPQQPSAKTATAFANAKADESDDLDIDAI